MFKQLVAANVSRIVSALSAGAVSTFTVQGEIEGRVGKLKNGDEANYVLLVNNEDNTITIELNPRKAEQLFKKNTVDNLTMEEVQATAPVVEATDKDEKAEKPAKEAKPPKEKKEKEVKAPKDPALNKNFHFIAAYKDAVAAATEEAPVSRKNVIADARKRVADAGLGELSDAAVNTYYQNCKSGKWGN